MRKIGFDNELYVKSQIETIKKRIKMFDNKLYLEFGGKLFDDHHAKRVLPGFELNAKIRLLEELKDKMLYYNVDYDLACSFNHYRNVNVHRNREKFFEKLSAGEINENNIIKYMKKYTKKPLYRKVLGKVKRIIKK